MYGFVFVVFWIIGYWVEICFGFFWFFGDFVLGYDVEDYLKSSVDFEVFLVICDFVKKYFVLLNRNLLYVV